MRAALAGLALISSVSCTVVASAQEDAPRRGAVIQWREGAPDAGEAVKVRVRGAALTGILAPDAVWRLTADGEELSAVLSVPQAPQPATTFDLAIIEHSAPDAAGLVAILDRGLSPAPMNRLRVDFASASVLKRVKIEASADRQAFTTAGDDQLAFQQVVDAVVLRLSGFECDPGNRRYLRLTVTDGGGLGIERVTAWHAEPPAQDLYEAPLALAAMRDGPAAGEHLWPLIMEHGAIPLTKLKVLADAPGSVRRIRLVLLDEELAPTRTVATTTWADELCAGGLARSEKWIQLTHEHIAPEAMTPERHWGIVVEDSGKPPLQLDGVQAYAAEVWLCFERPGREPVVLWLGEPARVTPEQGALGPQSAAFAGEISTIDIESPEGQTPAMPAPVRVFMDQAGGYARHWWRLGAYSLGGVIALLLGLALLRSRRAEAR